MSTPIGIDPRVEAAFAAYRLKWKPIETAPKDRTPILTITRYGNEIEILKWSAFCEEWQDYRGISPELGPAYWALLPSRSTGQGLLSQDGGSI